MQLLRVRVPNFRALKDVDITFEKDFVPQIFPLGSLNGGGKSTLLQLIFILLHRPSNYVYVINLFDYFILDDKGYCDIATLEVLDNHQVYEINFICSSINRHNSLAHSASYLAENLGIMHDDDKALFCRCAKLDSENLELLLTDLSNSIFLAAPSSQIYLFLSPEERKSLFKMGGNYNNALEKAKKSLAGFFTYDTSPVAEIVKFFRVARDMDFDEKVKTGHYGNHYDRMLHDINQIIAGKKVIPQLSELSEKIRSPDKDLIDSIIFKANDGTEIYPEGLSHGELKKLSIYAWLKANQIKNSIVLMDEIENGFHPDWQFQIVKELEAWEPSNQYILATHSYELCTALTPSHVKELEPKLLSTPK